MKKRICAALILLLVFSLCFGGSALAETAEDGLEHVTDAADILSLDDYRDLESYAAQLSEEGKVELYIVTMEDYTQYTTGDVLDCAGELYDYFSLGYGEDHSGVLLLLSMKELDFALIARGDYGNYCFSPDNMALVQNAFLNGCRDSNWTAGFRAYLDQCGDILRTAAANGLGLDQPYRDCAGLACPDYTYHYGVNPSTGETEPVSEPEPSQEPSPEPEVTAEPTAKPAREDGTLGYVTDSADILSDEQEARLESMAAQLSESLPCKIYIVTLQDYRQYTNGDVNNCTTELYTYYDLGYGPDRDGLILLLSMRERDYSIITHGWYGNYCFGDHNLNLIESAFLDNFRNNDWEGGFTDYLRVSGDILRTAQAHELSLEQEDQRFPGLEFPGNTYRYGVTGKLPVWIRLVIGIGGPCIVALIVCGVFKAQMKTAKERTTAEEYVVPGSATLRIRDDRFLNRTETRTRINSNSGSSGRGGFSSGGGGGFSGHSGKF